MFDELRAEMDFIILDNILLDIFFGRPTLQCFLGVSDFKAVEDKMKIRWQKAIVSKFSEYAHPRAITGKTDSKDFT